MQKSAIATLKDCGVRNQDISLFKVPGAWELPQIASKIAVEQSCDSIIALGCVIKGETSHFDFIASSTSNALQLITVQYHMPLIFGVLTTENRMQAVERADPNKKDKGREFALALINLTSECAKI